MSANTDNPRPWKKDVLKGEWSHGWNGDTCAVWGVAIVIGADKKQKVANAHLIAEAGTVLHQTGMTPGELAERVEYLNEYIIRLEMDAERLEDTVKELRSELDWRLNRE